MSVLLANLTLFDFSYSDIFLLDFLKKTCMIYGTVQKGTSGLGSSEFAANPPSIMLFEFIEFKRRLTD